MGDDITELDRIDVLAMVLQGRDGDHPSEFWRSRAHRLLNHREPLLAVLGMVEVQGAETCLTHIDGVLLETGSGVCDMSDDDEECSGAPLYRALTHREPDESLDIEAPSEFGRHSQPGHEAGEE